MQEVTTFNQIALKALEFIFDSLEEQDQDGVFIIDYATGMLNITTPRGIFVINKHTAAREIWLASPLSGPYHFKFIDNKWVDRKNKELLNLLELELGNFISINLKGFYS